MKTVQLILAFLFGAFLIFGGINHFTTPEFYDPFIPDFLPKPAVNYITGVMEILLGVGLFVPATRNKAALGTMLLMIAFLPIHVADVFKDAPAIGSQQAAWIRLAFQFVFITWSWWLWQRNK